MKFQVTQYDAEGTPIAVATPSGDSLNTILYAVAVSGSIDADVAKIVIEEVAE